MNDIRLVQGETIDLIVNVKYENGEDVNVEDYKAIFGSKIIGNKKMTILENQLLLTLTSEETLILPPKDYRYEIKVKTKEGKIKSILQGNLIISKGYVQFEEGLG